MTTNLPEGQLHASSLQCLKPPDFRFLDNIPYFPAFVQNHHYSQYLQKKDCEDFSSSWKENNKLMDYLIMN